MAQNPNVITLKPGEFKVGNFVKIGIFGRHLVEIIEVIDRDNAIIRQPSGDTLSIARMGTCFMQDGWRP